MIWCPHEKDSRSVSNSYGRPDVFLAEGFIANEQEEARGFPRSELVFQTAPLIIVLFHDGFKIMWNTQAWLGGNTWCRGYTSNFFKAIKVYARW